MKKLLNTLFKPAVVWMALLGAICAPQSYGDDGAQKLVIKPLAKTRSKIFNFKSFDQPSRRQTLESAKTLFESFYVNREQKKKLYGADPLAELAKLESTFTGLTDEQFHFALLTIFNSVHDVHTFYQLPKPYQCTVAYLPLNFQKASTGQVFVAEMDSSKTRRIEIGDQLLSFDGKTPLDIIRERYPFNSGALPDTVTHEGIKDLTHRDLGYSPVPEQDVAKLTLKNAKGKIYTTEVTWYTSTSNSCLKEAGLPRLRNLRPVSGPEAIVNERPFDGSPLKVDLSHLNRNPYYSNASWKVLPFQGHKIGYLQLSSFEYDTGSDGGAGFREGVQSSSPEDPFLAVSVALSHEFSATNSLLIDLRGNYGGNIEVAELIAALFTPPSQARAVPFYIRANPLTLAFSKEVLGSNWETLISPFSNTNQIVGPEFLTTVTNSEQMYGKKVTLLTDSACASACEIFTAAMKDNNNVTVYGTDHSTYGAGANFQDSKNIPGLNHPPEVSMRITLRGGHRLKDQSVIDDVGIPSDVVLEPSPEEIANPQSSRIVYQIIEQITQSGAPASE